MGQTSGEATRSADEPRDPMGVWTGIAAGAVAVLLLTLSVVLFSTNTEERDPGRSPEEVAVPTLGPLATPTPGPAELDDIPVQLRAAAEFEAEPSAESVAGLFEAVGGLEGLELATAEGPFDLVTFDPEGPDHLVAAHRTGYGEAQNQDRNQTWAVEEFGVSQELAWSGGQPHDFV
ncbi:MAG: hypothetical protein ACR2PK_00485, partial [Acidimicrobiales bacterium]